MAATQALTDLMKTLIKSSGNELASIISDGTATDIDEWIDTGSYKLNAQMSGSIFKGCPTNRLVGFGGESQTLKSIMARNILKNFLDANPENAIGYAFETENANAQEDYKQQSIDITRVIFTPISTIEDFKNQMTAILNKLNEMPRGKAPKVVFILDSYGNLVTEKTVEDAGKGANKVDMTKAKVAGQAFGIVTNKMMKHKYTLLMPNHVYDDVGSFFPSFKFSGGKKYIYLCSVVFTQTAAKIKDKDGNQIATQITFTTYKSRFTQPQKKTKVIVSFKHGVYRYSEMVDDAIEGKVWIDLGGKIITDPTYIDQLKLLEEVKVLKRGVPFKGVYDFRTYLIPHCIAKGFFAKNGEGYLVDRLLVENFPLYTQWKEEKDAVKKEAFFKQLEEKNINVSDYDTKTYTEEEFNAASLYNEIYKPADIKASCELYIKEQLAILEEKVKALNIDEDKIKATGKDKSSIEMNPKKFFTQEVLERMDEYYGKLFKFGSALEMEQVEKEMESQLGKDEEV